MVEKDGKQVPFFAADGKGKMSAGGSVPSTKGYFKGGKRMDKRYGCWWQDEIQRHRWRRSCQR